MSSENIACASACVFRSFASAVKKNIFLRLLARRLADFLQTNFFLNILIKICTYWSCRQMAEVKTLLQNNNKPQTEKPRSVGCTTSAAT